jgi:hypothetical protein
MKRKTMRDLAAFLLVGVLALAGAAGCSGQGGGGGKGAGPQGAGDDKGGPKVGEQGKFVPGGVVIKAGDTVEVPFILWGGDVATFHANGGLETRPGTLFHKHGLKVKLTRGDDFDKQVEAYVKGTSPFLRGTMSMLGQASEKICADERTRPVVFLQLTWSAGDHLVARAGNKTLADLKGKKIALQTRGPHVGMLNDILRTARLQWTDITPVWTDDVTGDKGPATLFRKDATVDACFAITPDMEDLTGGIEKTGDGKDKTVNGAHVLVSTAHMSRSIADVYACRKDFYDANRELVEKFAAGYLKAAEELLAMKREHKADKKGSAAFKAILKMTQDIYGKNDIKDDAAAEGLIEDAVFVGLPGNVSFFTAKGNLAGFDAKQRAAIDVAIALKDAEKRNHFLIAGFDYDKLKRLGELAGKAASGERFQQSTKFLEKGAALYSFVIHFEPDRADFSDVKYADDYHRALEQAALFGNCMIAIRGHADPVLLLNVFADEGLRKGVLMRKGGGDHVVFKDGSEITDMRKVLDLIEKENLVGSPKSNPKDLVRRLKELSDNRAKTVRESLLRYAGDRGVTLDKSQIGSVGVGVAEAIVVDRFADADRSAPNRRVEFRIIRVPAEAVEPEFPF